MVRAFNCNFHRQKYCVVKPKKNQLNGKLNTHTQTLNVEGVFSVAKVALMFGSEAKGRQLKCSYGQVLSQQK